MSSAFQDLLGPDNHCHGCGLGNPQGLRIKSYWEGQESVCHFQAQPHHCAASTDVVHGGILASVIDCHCNCTAMADAYRRSHREIGTHPAIWTVTANLNLNFRRPAPIAETLELRARITRQEGRKTWLSCTLGAAGVVCVEAEMLAIEVKRDSPP